MKKLFAVLTVCCLLVGLFAACGGGEDSSVAEPASVPEPESVASVPPAESVAEPADSTAAAGSYDLDAMLADLVEAANLGTTIKMSEIDLQAGGVDTANVVAFAGAEAQTYSDNGGIVVIIQTAPGMAEAVATDMEKFRASRMDDRYAEFATQLENTKNGALIQYDSDDLVIFAVSATAHEDGQALSDALASFDPASYAA